MNTLKRTLHVFLFVILNFCLLLSIACKSTGKAETDKLFFEPPDRLIDDYAGMVQTDHVNWAWTQIGFRFSNYQSLTLKPVQLFIQMEDQRIAEKLDQGLLTGFEEAGIQLSDAGTIVCEGAIVEVNLERSFLEKLNLFAEEKRDFLLQIEIVIKETATNTTICKIRHGAIAAETSVLPERVLPGIISFFKAHK